MRRESCGGDVSSAAVGPPQHGSCGPRSRRRLRSARSIVSSAALRLVFHIRSVAKIVALVTPAFTAASASGDRANGAIIGFASTAPASSALCVDAISSSCMPASETYSPTSGAGRGRMAGRTSVRTTGWSTGRAPNGCVSVIAAISAAAKSVGGTINSPRSCANASRESTMPISATTERTATMRPGVKPISKSIRVPGAHTVIGANYRRFRSGEGAAVRGRGRLGAVVVGECALTPASRGA